MPLIAEAIRTGWPVVSGCQPLAAERFDGQGLPRSNRTATEMATLEAYIPHWSSVLTSPPDDRPPINPSDRGHWELGQSPHPFRSWNLFLISRLFAASSTRSCGLAP